MGSSIRGTRLFALVVVVIVLADQATKWIVVRSLVPGHPWPGRETLVGRVFSFTHVHNTGVAFGMFQGTSNLFVVVSLAVVAALLVYRHRLASDSQWLQLALGLQIGGALGNLTDRLRLGHVTDFLDFKVWPVFNIGDSSIVLGVLLLAWYLWQDERAAGGASAPEEPVGPVEPAELTGPRLAPTLGERGD